MFRCDKFSMAYNWFGNVHDSSFEVITIVLLQYVQEVVTLKKKYLIYLHQKMRFTPFINYYETLQSKIILGHMNSIG